MLFSIISIRNFEEEIILRIYTISDSSGETAELVAKAAASLFEKGKIEVCKLPQVRTREHIKDLFKSSIQTPAIIVYTIVLKDAKDALIEYAQKYNIYTYDAFGELVHKLEKELNEPSMHQAGLRLKVDQDYFNRMDSIHFAIKYDDGQTVSGIENADVVLLGISRTGKTPCSMYLAQHYGLKVANIPIVVGEQPPKILYNMDSSKIFGFICDPLVLQSLRNTKAYLDYSQEYFDFEHIAKEVEYSKRVFNELKCHTVNMTNRAIEEIASEIISNLKLMVT
ncbi:MAG: kinase/pyrophosphorylase [Candidatus Melainabacteria bacterium]|nr:kinase/pyrophosphorylase [Candidatus Melainabacteria bacterium]MBI3309392.1 kinase/pyrophosphorylase [Candidatus Melainabacteria bacterium]